MCRHHFTHHLQCGHIPRLVGRIELCTEGIALLQEIYFDYGAGGIQFEQTQECPSAERIDDDEEGYCPVCVAYEEILGHPWTGGLRGEDVIFYPNMCLWLGFYCVQTALWKFMMAESRVGRRREE